MGRGRVAAAVMGCVIALGVVVPAETQERASRDLRRVEANRTAALTEARRSSQAAEAARRQIEDLTDRLVEAGARRAAGEAAVAAAEQRLAVLERQHRAASTNSSAASQQTARFAALNHQAQRAGDTRLAHLATAQARRAATLQRSAQADLRTATALTAAIQAERQALAVAQARLAQDQRSLEALLTEQRARRAGAMASAAAADQRAAALARRAQTLRQLADAAAPSRRSSARPVAPSVAGQAPVLGQLVRRFGDTLPGGRTSPGLSWTTRPSAAVRSPAAGEVAYAGPFRSFGQVIILSLDDGNAVVLSGLDDTVVGIGDRVRVGQPLGRMAAAATPSPELSLELRVQGRPVDPATWLRSPPA